MESNEQLIKIILKALEYWQKKVEGYDYKGVGTFANSNMFGMCGVFNIILPNVPNEPTYEKSRRLNEFMSKYIQPHTVDSTTEWLSYYYVPNNRTGDMQRVAHLQRTLDFYIENPITNE